MLALAGFLIILAVSFTIVRVAGVALSLTGMSRDSAMFQARSAWTGTGFTTAETEAVVGHPVRRRIISWLMVLRGAGFVTMIATLVVGLSGGEEDASALAKAGLLLGGLTLFWVVTRSRRFDRWMQRRIEKLLCKYTELDVRDYMSVFHLGEDYELAEIEIEEGGWMAGRTLKELNLPEEGALILGIERPRRVTGDGVQEAVFIGAPRSTTALLPGDRVTLYGRGEHLKALRERKRGLSGEVQRQQAVTEHEEVQGAEERKAEEAAESATPPSASAPPAGSITVPEPRA